MSISMDFGPILAALRDLEKLEPSLPKIADNAAGVARAVGIRALNQGIYNTAPGQYIRTRDVIKRFKVVPTADGFEISDDSDHAHDIEHGIAHVGGLDPDAASVDIETGTVKNLPGTDVTKNLPGYYGRSAATWQQPQPFVAPAAIIGFYRLSKGIEQYIENVIKRHAR